jgi:L-threonate 2-dehydrogenase
VSPIVTVIAAGSMGAGVGRRLADNGAAVRTSLAGRSAESARRARAANMIDCPDEELVNTDFILSIVPPGDAVALAQRLAPHLTRAARKPIYVDCNAVNPHTVERIAATIAASATPFVDAGIIGGPPAPGGKGPAIYVSGNEANRLQPLAASGLDVRVLDGPIGAASALKMSYAGITKGFTALVAMMLLAACRQGTAADVHAELAASQPELLAWLTRQVPKMFPKAYRWVAEMQEIAGFVGEDPCANEAFRAFAELYERLARDHAGERRETGALANLLAREVERARATA